MACKLKVGICLDESHVLAWQMKAIDQISHLPNVDFQTWIRIKNGQSPCADSGSTALRAFYNIERFLYCRATTLPDPFKKKKIKDRFTSAQIHDAENTDYIIRKNLDVIIYFGISDFKSGQIKGLANLSRYGVMYHAIDSIDNVSLRKGVMPSEVWRMPAVGEKQLLFQSWSGVRTHSIYLNHARGLWQSAKYIPRLLSKIKRPEELGDLPQVKDKTPPQKNICENRIKIRSVLKRLISKLLITFFGREEWEVRVYVDDKRASEAKLGGSSGNKYYADPFIFCYKGQWVLFIEEYRYKQKKGVICASEMRSDMRLDEPKVIIESESHLSYPYIFEDQEKAWMIPETKGAGSISIYRCLDFPYVWEKEKILIDGVDAVDSSLVKYDSRYWLFTSIVDKITGASDELFLYYADNLLGAWKPHPLNPIISDVRISRGAGKIYYDKGRLIRPAQDCSTRYGLKVVLNQIIQIDEKSYSERTLEQFGDGWEADAIGVHTWNQSGNTTVLDKAVWKPIWKK